MSLRRATTEWRGCSGTVLGFPSPCPTLPDTIPTLTARAILPPPPLLDHNHATRHRAAALTHRYPQVRLQTLEGAYALTHVDEVVDDMLRKDFLFDIALPRVPSRWAGGGGGCTREGLWGGGGRGTHEGRRHGGGGRIDGEAGAGAGAGQ